MSEDLVKKTIRLPRVMVDALEERAEADGEPFVAIVTQMLSKALEHEHRGELGVPLATAAPVSEDVRQGVRHCELLLMQVIDAVMSEKEADAAIEQAKKDLGGDFVMTA